jgi:formylglycine-generating enzyme required for sulfatase activity
MNASKFNSDKNKPGDVFEISISDKLTIPFCFIPAGIFTMGSPENEEGRYSGEGGNVNLYIEDQTEVEFSHSFWMAKTPVTQRQWKAVTGKNKGRFKGPDRPVEGISYLDVLSFLADLSSQHQLPDGWRFAAPTEAQWEYACRAGEKGPYSGGSLNEVGWFEDNSEGKTHNVALKKPNAWGLHDMHGNVKEMCWVNGLHRKGLNPAGHDPVDADCYHSNIIVFRGGSWRSDPGDCRSAARFGITTLNDNGNSKLSTYGFRIVIVPDLDHQSGIAADKHQWATACASNKSKDRYEKKSNLDKLTLPHNAGDWLNLYIPQIIPLTFRYIPSGSFVMGSPEDESGRQADENQVQVILGKPFWLADGPVTQIQWEAVEGTNPSEMKGERLPVTCVSWEDAVNYINKLNKNMHLPSGWKFALPTEAQWEYACRAGNQGSISEGDMDNICWHAENSDDRTHHAVGYKHPNAWELYNMQGNVMEWCADWYADRLAGGIDPHGPVTGDQRVYRGGSAFDGYYSCRAASRFCAPPGEGDYDIGFRLAIVQSE